MPFFNEIRCPTNGRLLASFVMMNDYYYRLSNSIEYPLNVAFAWCHQCERFVECERFDTIEKIEEQLAGSTPHRDYWAAILDWRQQRKTPPRCLTCGSFSAIHVLPDARAIEHPDGNCLVEVRFGGHVILEEWPDICYFDSEGRLIESRSASDITNEEVESWMRSVREKHGISKDMPPIEDQ